MEFNISSLMFVAAGVSGIIAILGAFSEAHHEGQLTYNSHSNNDLMFAHHMKMKNRAHWTRVFSIAAVIIFSSIGFSL
ncbi:hypothetical protein ACX818_001372 [Acinetobacter baumannii]